MHPVFFLPLGKTNDKSCHLVTQLTEIKELLRGYCFKTEYYNCIYTHLQKEQEKKN